MPNTAENIYRYHADEYYRLTADSEERTEYVPSQELLIEPIELQQSDLIKENEKNYQEIQKQKDKIINALEQQVKSSINNIGDMPKLEDQLKKTGNLKSKNANKINVPNVEDKIYEEIRKLTV